MANNTALDFINPGSVLQGATILGDGQSGLQSIADALNHIYAESATVLFQWPARAKDEGLPIGEAKSSRPGDTLFDTYVRQPDDRSSWRFATIASVDSGTFEINLTGSTDGSIATNTVTTGGSIVTQTASASISTLAQTLTVNVFATIATNAIVYAVILYLADESI